MNDLSGPIGYRPILLLTIADGLSRPEGAGGDLADKLAAPSFCPKLLQPQSIILGTGFKDRLKPASDHLINFLQPDPKDLRQDFPGGLQLHRSGWPAKAYYGSAKMW
jgi:hypothetical protein